MDPYLEIATSLASKSVTFIVGTGLSRFLTNNAVPNWHELIERCTKVVDEHGRLTEHLFLQEHGTTKARFELSICAQMLELEYKRVGLDLRQTVCEILRESTGHEVLDEQRLKLTRDFFDRYDDFSIVTTNYDSLLSENVLPNDRRIFFDGSVLSKMNQGRNIYHIHGSVADPRTLILTMSDYFNFQHQDTYLSKKFFTLLQETTVVILGYSLGDFNLNEILHESMLQRNGTFRRSDTYYVTGTKVNDLQKRYYFNTYGIHVIDECPIERFFGKVTKKRDEAEQIITKTSELQDVMAGVASYSDDFLKLHNSLPRILIAASTLGIPLTDVTFQNQLVSILGQKVEFTSIDAAWEQYAHLAEWLSEVCSLIDLSKSQYREDFLRIILHSISKMSKNLVGYSWKAFEIWKSQWTHILDSNRELIRDLINRELPLDQDAQQLLSK